MKKLISIVLLVFITCSTYASGDPYEEAMKSGMELLETAQNAEDFLSAANHFERIANVATDRWHPAYYIAYAQAIAATREKDGSKIDELLDAAESFLKKAAAMDHDKSEVAALQGFVHMLRVGVDPGTRGQEYSMMSSASLQKAVALNPDNPRAVFLQAQLSFGTAQFFGSDTSEACAANARALEIFEKNELPSETDPFAPRWGKRQAISFQKQCTD
jgi:tetratricopeptide (TPR) repeat protein